MAIYTPQIHSVWNELDEFGLLFDLPRIEGELNKTYKQRLFDVFVNRANSTYRGLINGITRELGLSLYHAMTITPVWNSGGTDFKGANPAVVFDETKCYVYSDYTLGSSGLVLTIDRYEKASDTDTTAYTMGELVQEINSTGYVYAVLQSGVSDSARSMCIFNQKSIDLVVGEDLSKGSVVVNLDNQYLLSSSVSISSSNLATRVATQEELVKEGQYFIDYDLGIVYTVIAPEPGSLIRYEYANNNFEVWASPVIIHNLQSADFKTKMFEQILMDNAEYTNGAPTEVGADTVNELMSVFPTFFDE
jgi:hypothetical protein